MSWNGPLETKPIAAMVIYMMYESMSKSRPVFLCLPLCALFVEVLSCVSCISWLIFPANAQTASVQTVAEGPDWIPLECRRDIEPGSALDSSGLGIHDAPSGKHGWLRSAGGHAEFVPGTGVAAWEIVK